MQLGNSVPPQVGRILALSVLDQVFNVDLPFKIKYMPQSLILGFRKRKSGLTKIYAQKAKNAIALQTKNGDFEIRYSNLIKGKEKQYLVKGIELRDEKTEGGIAFNFDFKTNCEEWSFTLVDSESSQQEQYSIDIILSETHSSILNTKKIRLLSFSHQPSSLAALWKFLEKTLRKIAHKDDLIQLFGYYQYRQNSNFKFSFINIELKNSIYWKIVKNITEGLAIGTPLHIAEIADIFQLNQPDFLESVKTLKTVGYEIRNHNTNSQLKKDCYLIPYQFPTLNERSLQRLTSL